MQSILVKSHNFINYVFRKVLININELLQTQMPRAWRETLRSCIKLNRSA